jgi:peptide/nickel transport system substrate-binding protein
MKRTIFSSLIIGIIIFFACVGLLNYYLRPLIYKTTENVGYAGTYTVQTIPNEILNQVSYGLTKVNADGEIVPGAAESWTIKSNKIYTFKLKKGLYFHNGDELTSSNVNFNFKNVTSKAIDRYTIQYTLKEPYAPFLVSVAGPILDKSLSGIGRYKIANIDLNGGFVRTITLDDTKSKGQKKVIYFYPTQEALKVAFMLGEVSRAFNLDSTKVDNISNLSTWKKVKTKDFIDYTSLVTIFYNNNDTVLSDKKVRQALNYALPEKVKEGERAYGPISPNSIYFQPSPSYKISDINLSKTLLSTVKESLKDPLVISTTDEYVGTAKEIQAAWKKIGILSKIEIVNGIPSNFQILLYKIKLPEDPDQYVLWHSNQQNNIVHYKNLRIDKLLEDGRSTTDITKRKNIYADFQKYLTDDVPASFFYFPREYDISKE